MNKSELFKAAHKLAKVYKKQLGGDYVAYLSYSLKAIIKSAKRNSKESLFEALNKVIIKRGGDDLITYPKKVLCSHGLKEFSHKYKLDNYKRELQKGRFLGEAFVKNGMFCAWERSYKIEQVAY